MFQSLAYNLHLFIVSPYLGSFSSWILRDPKARGFSAVSRCVVVQKTPHSRENYRSCGGKKKIWGTWSKIPVRKGLYIKIICGNNYSVLLISSECPLTKIWKCTINQFALGKITTSLRVLLLASKSSCFAWLETRFWHCNIQSVVSNKYQV